MKNLERQGHVPQHQSHEEPLTGMKEWSGELILEPFLQTGNECRLMVQNSEQFECHWVGPTAADLGQSRLQSRAASCVLIGWLSENQEVDFGKAEWNSFIRSWKRRPTWRKHRIGPLIFQRNRRIISPANHRSTFGVFWLLHQVGFVVLF